MIHEKSRIDQFTNISFLVHLNIFYIHKYDQFQSNGKSYSLKISKPSKSLK